MARRKKRSYSAALQHHGPRRGEISGDTFLIVVEGEGTEIQYFTGLRDTLLRRKAFEVEVHHPPVTDPVRLVQAAIDSKAARAEAASESMAVNYDQVWVVMDRERQHCERREQIPKARELAAENGILIAVSNPCFEFWLMLHYRDRPGPFRDSKHCHSELRKHIPNYSKTRLPLAELLERDRIGKATKRAKQCENYHADSGGDGNPSSEVYKLLLALNASVPHERRII